MSEELKTLNYLGWFYNNGSGRIMVYKDELKAEAVKRANHYKKKSEGFESVLYWKGRFDEVMEANDLTVKDLEEKEE